MMTHLVVLPTGTRLRSQGWLPASQLLLRVGPATMPVALSALPSAQPKLNDVLKCLAARVSTGRTAASTWLALGRERGGAMRQEAQSRTSPQLSSWQTAAWPGVPGATNVQLCHCTKSCGGGEPEQIGAGRVASAQEDEGVQVALPQGLGSQS